MRHSVTPLETERTPVLRRYFEVLDSTQAEAKRWVEAEGAVEGRVVAAAQSRGVGRGDHHWESPKGGLYLSSIVPLGSGVLASLLPLAIGAGVADDLAAGHAFRPALKWPNDLVVDRPGRAPSKFGGLLIDRLTVRPRQTVVIVGLGLNVRLIEEDLPAALRGSATSLGQLSTTPGALDDLERRADEAIRRAVRAVETETGRHRALDRVRALLYGIGRRARVDGVPAGVIRGVTESGALVLERDGVESMIVAGDLTIEPERVPG